MVQLAYSWLNGHLASIRPQYTRDAAGLAQLAADFPQVSGLGAETHPLLPGGISPGGCLGGTLAFSHGLAMAAPERIAVPIIGDGECETPTTAASWLAARTLDPCRVLPILHLNGFRMGSRSLLGAMTETELEAYFSGLGWHARVVRVDGDALEAHRAFSNALADSIQDVVAGTKSTVVFSCVKGWTGPESVDGIPLLGTARLHKTPLTLVRDECGQQELLERWLVSYRPAELFDRDARPVGVLAEALNAAVWNRGTSIWPAAEGGSEGLELVRPKGFGDAVAEVLVKHAAQGDFHLFSPDELQSNHLGSLASAEWTSEVLAEEILLGWLGGWTASGRRGLLVSYEAFAPLFTSGLIGHLKHRRLAGRAKTPSLNVLLTSYGWHNTYTHGDPSLATALLATEDPAVHVLTPADPHRTAVALDSMLESTDNVNIVIAGKHSKVRIPELTIKQEMARGLAIWPHLSDPQEPELTFVAAGDLAAAVISAAVPNIRRQLGCSIRVVGLLDLTVLGDPRRWPRGMTDAEVRHFLGERSPVVIATIGHPAAVWGLLAGRVRRPVRVIGWREPRGPMPQQALAHELAFDSEGLLQAAIELTTTSRQEPCPNR